MAAHIVTQIRDAVYTAVKGAGTGTAGNNVFKARPRTHILQAADLPALLVYTNGDEGELSSGTRGSRRVAYVLDVSITGYAKSTGDIDATLDAMRKDAQVALAADPTLGGLAKDCWLRSAEKEMDDEAEKPLWSISMTFEVEYHINESAPDAALA
jgi:hypothetical protein